MAEKMQRLEKVIIPTDIDFKQLKSLSSEAIEKLTQIQPTSIGQASRISGVSPSDISVLLIYLGR
jgi:tRNA uridine 5-carboxymethylaminomethyl modification enzyme